MWGSELGGRKPRLKQGRHPEKALTALQVKNLKAPGRYADGGGLYLVVDPSGSKRWLLRVVVHGRRRDIGVGGLSVVPLSEARERAVVLRKVARQGGDPLSIVREGKRVVPTFKAAAEQVHAEREMAWRNPKHAAQWISTLREYAFPTIGDYRIDSVDTPAILRVLAPIWLTKKETAKRVRQRIGVVLDWAKASGYRHGDNPIAGVAKGLPSQTRPINHHAALPYAEVPAFVRRLHETSSGLMTKLAFEFLIVTAGRTSEILLARRPEVDLGQRVWTVPADRMKTKKAHRVPLCDRAAEIINQAFSLVEDSAYVFPSDKPEKPLSNMVFLKMIGRMQVKTTAHGFRSSFRDWASETTSFPNEVAEMALAHTVEKKVEAAYRRGDLLDKRRDLMSAWGDFVSATPRR